MKNRRIIIAACCLACLWGGGIVHAATIDIDTFSPFVYPDYSKKISMDFQDAPLIDVLKIFSKQTDLNLITSESIADIRITVYLDHVSIEEALEQILRANNLTYDVQRENSIYIVKPITKPAVELLTRIYHLQHASVNSSKVMKTLSIKITGQASQSGLAGRTGITAAISGILTSNGTIIEDPRTNSLIITDIASNFPPIDQAIAQLDVPVTQILIELEMLEVTKITADKIGVKWGDSPLIFTSGSRETIFPFNEQKLRDSGKISDPAYTVGSLNATGLTATLQFLRTQTDTKTLARPRILTLNYETAQIKITTDEAIGLETTTTSSEGTSTSAKEAERVETGVSLTVTPQANLLTREIIMAVVPKVSIARTGATFDGIPFKDPEERTSQSIMRVNDGDTIILGGLLRTDISNTITKVPILGDIPLIGRVFRHNDESITEKELIIFITPHILDERPALETAATATQIPSASASLRTQGKEATAQVPSRTQLIIREQDIPQRRLKEVERELSLMEKRAL